MSKYAIFSRAIPSATGKSRSEAEREATSALIAEAFGENAILEHDDNGRPYIIGTGNVHISISHCIDECILAVSDEPIGVDIETERKQLERVAGKFLTATERLRGLYDLKSLLMLWTAKEAVFKCAEIPSLTISEIEISADMVSATARGMRFKIHHHYGSQRVIAIAERVQTRP